MGGKASSGTSRDSRLGLTKSRAPVVPMMARRAEQKATQKHLDAAAEHIRTREQNPDPSMTEEKLAQLTLDMDPDKKGNNQAWIVNQVRDGLVGTKRNDQGVPEDADKVQRAITGFQSKSMQEKLKRDGKPKDIGKYSLTDIDGMLKAAPQKAGGVARESITGIDGVKIHNETDKYLVIQSETVSAAEKLGKGTKWCTRAGHGGGMAPEYLGQRGREYGGLFQVFEKDRDGSLHRLYQYTGDFSQFKQVTDEELPQKDFDDELIGAVKPSRDNLKNRVKYAEKFGKRDSGLEDDLVFERDLLNTYQNKVIEPLVEQNPESQELLAVQTKIEQMRQDSADFLRATKEGRRVEQLEDAIIKKPKAAAAYIAHSLTNRDGTVKSDPGIKDIYEKMIAAVMPDPEAVLELASQGNRRVPEAEDMLAETPKHALKYFKDVLTNQQVIEHALENKQVADIEAAERKMIASIARDGQTSLTFSQGKAGAKAGRFEPGEDAIEKDPGTALHYLRVLRGESMELAEAESYGRDVNEDWRKIKAAIERMENSVAKDWQASIAYAADTGGRFKKGEPVIMGDPTAAVEYLNMLDGRGENWGTLVTERRRLSEDDKREVADMAKKVIIKSASASLEYAVARRERFPEGEKAIAGVPGKAREYLTGVLLRSEDVPAEVIDTMLDSVSKRPREAMVLASWIGNNRNGDTIRVTSKKDIKDIIDHLRGVVEKTDILFTGENSPGNLSQYAKALAVLRERLPPAAEKALFMAKNRHDITNYIVNNIMPAMAKGEVFDLGADETVAEIYGIALNSLVEENSEEPSYGYESVEEKVYKEIERAEEYFNKKVLQNLRLLPDEKWQRTGKDRYEVRDSGKIYTVWKKDGGDSYVLQEENQEVGEIKEIVANSMSEAKDLARSWRYEAGSDIKLDNTHSHSDYEEAYSDEMGWF